MRRIARSAEADGGAGVGAQMPPRWNDDGGVAETLTMASDASAQEVLSLKAELQRRDSKLSAHTSEVVALKAELEAARAIASAQMEELRAKMHEEQHSALTALRNELEAARAATAQIAPPASNPLATVMQQQQPLQLGSMHQPPDEAAGTASVAMASAHMLLQQASAAAQIIQALAATVRDLEDGRKR